MRESTNSTKKFGLKQWFAGLLALLMIVTALPVNGLFGALEAQAAEDTVDVYRAYNPYSYGHLWTTDTNEYAVIPSLGWTGEGVAWKAPVSSSTEVFRLFNPNTDEHLLALAGEAAALSAIGWTNEGRAFYSDDAKGVPIYRVNNPNEDGPAAHHFCGLAEGTALVARGYRWDNGGQPMIYGVETSEDKSDMIKLVDKDGLQTDETALTTDELEVSYGSDLGTPKTILWYCNGAVKAAFTLEGGVAMSRGFNSKTAITGNLDEGEWYVSIENTAGKTFVTNKLTVTDVNTAKVSGLAITNDYVTAYGAGLTFDAADDKAVMSVTLNKDYDGKLYVYKESTAKYNNTIGAGTGNAVAVLDLVNTTTTADNETGAANKTLIEEKTKTSQMTEANAIALETARTAGIGSALKYVDKKTGTVTYMFIPGNGTNGVDSANNVALDRGTKYKVVFDQDDIDTDNITGTDRSDVTVSEAVEAPYLKAPAALTVASYNKEDPSPTILAFVGSDGKVMDWWTELDDNGDPVNVKNTTISSANMYNVASNAAKESDDPITVTQLFVGKGLAQAYYNGSGETYAYAKIRTVAGVFGKDAIELTTAVSESAPVAAESISVAEASVPENADITFTGLHNKADGTVYLIQGETSAATQGAIIAKGTDAAVGSAKVTGGSTSASIANVFKGSQINATDNSDKFVAVFVPDDEATYSRVYSDLFTLTSKPTSLSFADVADDSSTVVTDDGSADTTVVFEPTSASVSVLNQFGTVITENGDEVEDKAATVTAVNAGGMTNEKFGGATYSVDADGNLTVDIERSSAIDYGDGFKVEVLGSTFTFTSKYGVGGVTVAVNNDLYTVKLGSNTLLDTDFPTAITVSTEQALVSALAAAADSEDVDTTVTTAGTIELKRAVKVAEGDALTLGGTFTNKGVITTEGALTGTIGVEAGTWNLNSKTGAQTLATLTALAGVSWTTSAHATVNIDPGEATTVATGTTLTIPGYMDLSVGDNATLNVTGGKLTVAANATLVSTGVVTSTAATLENNGTITDNGTAASFAALTSGTACAFYSTNQAASTEITLSGTATTLGNGVGAGQNVSTSDTTDLTVTYAETGTATKAAGTNTITVAKANLAYSEGTFTWTLAAA